MNLDLEKCSGYFPCTVETVVSFKPSTHYTYTEKIFNWRCCNWRQGHRRDSSPWPKKSSPHSGCFALLEQPHEAPFSPDTSFWNYNEHNFLSSIPYIFQSTTKFENSHVYSCTGVLPGTSSENVSLQNGLLWNGERGLEACWKGTRQRQVFGDWDWGAAGPGPKSLESHEHLGSYLGSREDLIFQELLK